MPPASGRSKRASPRAISSAQIEACIRTLVEQRAPSSICPSDVARALAPADFRPLMPRVRAAAARLVARGEVVVTQQGKAVDVTVARGPIRIVGGSSGERES